MFYAGRMEAPERVIARIFDRVDCSDVTACWMWPGAVYSPGCGHISWQVNNQQFHRTVHRVVYEALVGPIPEGMDLDHLCHDPAICHPDPASACPHRRCCNPSHLEPVSRSVNLRRGGTVAAERAARTHCPQGHPYDDANTYFDTKGRRVCRECSRAWNRDYASRNREKLRAHNKAYRERRREWLRPYY
jgi:hypothetical protein